MGKANIFIDSSQSLKIRFSIRIPSYLLRLVELLPSDCDSDSSHVYAHIFHLSIRALIKVISLVETGEIILMIPSSLMPNRGRKTSFQL